MRRNEMSDENRLKEKEMSEYWGQGVEGSCCDRDLISRVVGGGGKGNRLLKGREASLEESMGWREGKGGDWKGGGGI